MRFHEATNCFRATGVIKRKLIFGSRAGTALPPSPRLDAQRLLCGGIIGGGYRYTAIATVMPRARPVAVIAGRPPGELATTAAYNNRAAIDRKG